MSAVEPVEPVDEPYADTEPTPEPESSTPPHWGVEIWSDPAWYATQGSPDPFPAAGPPVTVQLSTHSALVGRAAAGRNLQPEVDCADDSGVSRRHAQLSTDGRRWWVEDLESANGTFVGSARGELPEHPLPVGHRHELAAEDRIYLGAWTRLVVRPAAEDPPD